MAKWQPQPDEENEPLTISTNTPTVKRSIPTPLVDEPSPTPPRVLSDPSNLTTIRETTAWDADQRANSLTGPFDAFAAKVAETWDGTVEPETKYQQAISFERAGVHYKTNNEPQAYDSQPAKVQPTLNRGVALPFPARHDQAAYIAAEGDCVTILGGRDGRYYYLADDLPFFGVIVARDNSGGGMTAADLKERYNGGAGNTVVKVRRQKITGAPPGTLGDLLTAAGATITYDNVTLVGPVEQAAGVRCSDCVMVHRRGLYYYAYQARELFVASIMAAGPDGEKDFTVAERGSDTNHYWVQEKQAAITYDDGTGGTSANEWATDGDSAGLESRSVADADGGLIARHVVAVNINEAATHHDATRVGKRTLVMMFADPDSGEIWYGFDMMTADDLWTTGHGPPPPGGPGYYYIDLDTGNIYYNGTIYNYGSATGIDVTGEKYMVYQITVTNTTAAFDWLHFAGT